MSETTIHQAVNAWILSPCADDWPRTIDAISIATWRGEEIVWPQFEGESFQIVRLDGTEVSEDELSSEKANRLHWRFVEIEPPLLLGPGSQGARDGH
jgi:hypothetical protein